jgi:hypothetical protein
LIDANTFGVRPVLRPGLNNANAVATAMAAADKARKPAAAPADLNP